MKIVEDRVKIGCGDRLRRLRLQQGRNGVMFWCGIIDMFDFSVTENILLATYWYFERLQFQFKYTCRINDAV